MAHTMVLVDRDALFDKLRVVFDTATTDTLLDVLNDVATQVYESGVPREDFRELKGIVAQLAEEQRKLAEEQRKLAEEQRKLTEAQQRTEARLLRVEEALEELIIQVKDLTLSQRIMDDKLGRLDGKVLELTYREKAPAYFGPLLRRPKVVNVNTLWDALEESLASSEFNQVLALDLIVKGKPRQALELGDVYLAVEVSAVIDAHDVERACERAKLLQKAGFCAIPTIAGERLTLGAEELSKESQVLIFQDGRRFQWEKALKHWGSGNVLP